MLFKKILLIVGMIFMLTNTAYAEKMAVPQELRAYGEEIYQGARSYFGRSFDGYCGTYVRCQLRAMGIFDNKFDFRGNGNQWYSNFENVQKTSGGYYVYRVSGGDCLTETAQKYGNNLSNIVLSFPVQAGYSPEYPGAGHALVIYRLKDGIAYYSESFSFGENREGEVIAEDASKLVERYSRRHGSPIGCVLLSETELENGCEGFVVEETPPIDDFIAKEMRESLLNIADVIFVTEKIIGVPVIEA